MLAKGDTFCTRHGKATIIEYNGWRDVLVRFNATGTIVRTNTSNIAKGLVKDRNSKITLGFVGVGLYTPTNHRAMYTIWKSMHRRVARQREYSDVKIYKKWYNFQNFAPYVQKLPNFGRPGFSFDKDLRVLGSREYHPDTCSFVPEAVNSLLNSIFLNMVLEEKKSKNSTVPLRRKKKLRFMVKEERLKYVHDKIKIIRLFIKPFKKDVHKDVYNNLRRISVRDIMVLYKAFRRRYYRNNGW